MVHAYHVVISAYGFWLPNDPRGSWSDFVRSWELFRFGPATKTDSTRSVASKPHDLELRQRAKRALQHPPFKFTGHQALSVARGFGHMCEKSQVVIWACAIMPEHLHLVIARHRLKVEQIVNLLKGRATKQLLADGRHPFDHLQTSIAEKQEKLPSPWSRSCWKVFLNDEAAIDRAIRYVEFNPVKEKKRRQHWSFVTPFHTESRRPVDDR